MQVELGRHANPDPIGLTGAPVRGTRLAECHRLADHFRGRRCGRRRGSRQAGCRPRACPLRQTSRLPSSSWVARIPANPRCRDQPELSNFCHTERRLKLTRHDQNLEFFYFESSERIVFAGSPFLTMFSDRIHWDIAGRAQSREPCVQSFRRRSASFRCRKKGQERGFLASNNP